MSSFEIVGGKRLSGEIVPQGAKNEALHRFKVDQIEVGKNNTEHQGYWRFYLNSEFDTKSPKGKFFKRTP